MSSTLRSPQETWPPSTPSTRISGRAGTRRTCFDAPSRVTSDYFLMLFSGRWEGGGSSGKSMGETAFMNHLPYQPPPRTSMMPANQRSEVFRLTMYNPTGMPTRADKRSSRQSWILVICSFDEQSGRTPESCITGVVVAWRMRSYSRISVLGWPDFLRFDLAQSINSASRMIATAQGRTAAKKYRSHCRLVVNVTTRSRSPKNSMPPSLDASSLIVTDSDE